MLLLSLFVATMIVYPYDPPNTGLLDNGGGNKGSGKAISMMSLAGRFNQFSVACVIGSVLWTYCSYESILEPAMELYAGVSPTWLAIM